jgi:hypothetical protein
MVERLFNTKIKQIQTDWGGKFRPLNTFFHKHGILHRIFCPHTHQQQRCVECKHRHIIDTSLALLADSHVPKPFGMKLAKLHVISSIGSPHQYYQISLLFKSFLIAALIRIFSEFSVVLVFLISVHIINTNFTFGPKNVSS